MKLKPKCLFYVLTASIKVCWAQGPKKQEAACEAQELKPLEGFFQL